MSLLKRAFFNNHIDSTRAVCTPPARLDMMSGRQPKRRGFFEKLTGRGEPVEREPMQLDDDWVPTILRTRP